jgi:hypothetical protein
MQEYVQYELTGNVTPYVFILNSNHTRRNPLRSAVSEEPRFIRYCKNERSIFVDEQSQHARASHIIFNEGVLSVEKRDTITQEFLEHHPFNGTKFKKRNPKKEASEVKEVLDVEYEAATIARNMSLSDKRAIYRVVFGKDPVGVDVDIIDVDIRFYARENPEEFLEEVNNPLIKSQSKVTDYIKLGVLSLRNQNRDFYFNITGNKKKIKSFPSSLDVKKDFAEFLLTEEGRVVSRELNKGLKEG